MRTASVIVGLVSCGLVACGDSNESQTGGNINAGGQGGAPQTPGMSAGASGSAVSAGAGGMAPAAQGGMGGMSGVPPTAGASGTPASPDAGTSDGGGDEPPAQPCAADMEMNPADADPCTAPLRPGEDRLCEFSYDGQMRKFYIYAPPSFSSCQPAAMVVDAHGASESAEVHIGVDRFSADAPLGYGSSWRLAVQGDNAIVVTPEGIGLRWARTTDPAFLNTVADMVEATADVDPEKRYITGISMGGMITVQTGCEDTNRWRGMAPVAMLQNTCPSIDRPIPHIAFHATTDALTSYAADEMLAEQMVQLNGCDTTPETVYYGGPNTSSEPVCFEMPYGVGSPDAPDPFAIPLSACPADRPESSCQVWTGCDEGVEVRFCTVPGANQELGGHLLYRNDTSLALGPLAWQFFKKFWK
jgi:polyhydroxybutyrate depolymerase